MCVLSGVVGYVLATISELMFLRRYFVFKRTSWKRKSYQLKTFCCCTIEFPLENSVEDVDIRQSIREADYPSLCAFDRPQRCVTSTRQCKRMLRPKHRKGKFEKCHSASTSSTPERWRCFVTLFGIRDFAGSKGRQ